MIPSIGKNAILAACLVLFSNIEILRLVNRKCVTTFLFLLHKYMERLIEACCSDLTRHGGSSSTRQDTQKAVTKLKRKCTCFWEAAESSVTGIQYFSLYESTVTTCCHCLSCSLDLFGFGLFCWTFFVIFLFCSNLLVHLFVLTTCFHVYFASVAQNAMSKPGVPFHRKRDIPKSFCATGCMENQSCEGEKGEKHAVCLPNPNRKMHFVLMTVTCEPASAWTTTHRRVLFYVLCHFQHCTCSKALRLLPKHTKLITWAAEHRFETRDFRPRLQMLPL